jgi:hypothetical protein
MKYPAIGHHQPGGRQADPTNASPILFTVSVQRAGDGFTAGDVSLAGRTLGGSVASVTGSGANYTVSVTGMNGTTVGWWRASPANAASTWAET